MTDEVIPTQSSPTEQPVSPTDATQQVAQPSQPPAVPDLSITIPSGAKKKKTTLPPSTPWYKRLRGVHYAGAALVGVTLVGAIAISQPAKPTHVIPTPVASQSAVLKPAIISGTVCHATYVVPNDPQAVLPDSKCTPGATNPAVTQATIGQTICVVGYTATIRPSASVTNTLKAQSMRDYGFTDSLSAHEEDHLISLELGGAAADVHNLWAEPHAAPNEKDKVENFLHAQVCSGKMSLIEAQREISTNWYKVFLTL